MQPEEIKQLIVEFGLDKALDITVEKIKDIWVKNFKDEFFKRKKKKVKDGIEENLDKSEIDDTITINQEHILKNIELNIIQANKWSQEISFKDLQRPKVLSEVFINIDFYLTPVSSHVSTTETKISLENVLGSKDIHNVIFLGGPGAGKTTLTKNIFQKILNQNVVFGKDNFFPIVFRLRDLSFELIDDFNIKGGLFYLLANFFDLNVKEADELFRKDSSKEKLNLALQRLVIEFLDYGNFALILDGFDEILNDKVRKQISNDIRLISMSTKNSFFVLTSRTGEFDYENTKARVFEIAPLDKNQIKEFISKWFNNEKKSIALYEQILRSPFIDAALRPLNLAHLCALYERNGTIPDRPKSIYKKIIFLLLEEWDSQRRIERHSSYANFTSDRKFEFLSQLAFILSNTINKSSFTKEELQKAYLEICSNYELPSNEAAKVVLELENHTGLFIQSGFDSFEFSHKSLQEYLTAEFICRIPSLSYEGLKLDLLPNELAISVSISSNPNIFFSQVVSKIELRKNFGFMSAFLRRIQVEKPDFNDSPVIAAALCSMYGDSYEFNNKEIIFLIGSLIGSHLNIQKSFKKVLEYYSSKSFDFYNLNKMDLSNGEHLVLIQKKILPGFEGNAFETIALNDIMYKLTISGKFES